MSDSRSDPPVLPMPPTPSDAELRARFFPHGPTDQLVCRADVLADRFFELARLVRDLVPLGRESNLAQTHLEEAKHWAVKAAARGFGIAPEPAGGEPVAVPRGAAG